jgi:hypothetical protein
LESGLKLGRKLGELKRKRREGSIFMLDGNGWGWVEARGRGRHEIKMKRDKVRIWKGRE